MQIIIDTPFEIGQRIWSRLDTDWSGIIIGMHIGPGAVLTYEIYWGPNEESTFETVLTITDIKEYNPSTN